ncbi:MAG TPA: SUMF1/EgtB/PvdO family nonheme iron enzyme [Candidatus Kapabacteria bacterium]|nr:SUMF1/EgtB/PvdO family nonheme iron enzyme [Candidatus Kapabacteria bacterium]HPO61845.1 SUMF1/EgtB/PvdO family nonheme iron enzyme [Candidatus Kapabacteria bacterium]
MKHLITKYKHTLIKKFCLFLSLALSFLIFPYISFANNLAIGTLAKVEQNQENGYFMLQFDMSWDNSWRLDSEPNNYDGVWLFAKYKKNDGKWYHCTLNETNFSTGSQGNGATIEIVDSKGALYYRSENGRGKFASENIKLRWDYSVDGLDDLAAYISEIKIYGIEMVYIPQAPFYVGSGGTEYFPFYTFGNKNPYQITSEEAINVGETDGFLYYKTGTYSGDGAGPIPASFPKGFNHFWCMKYEITQQQYADFLNTLTETQAKVRFPNYYNSYRNFIKKVDTVYGCDANNNNKFNEQDDGNNIACNYISWADGIAYADWAAMRPITELEFEKASRGHLLPFVNGFASGDTVLKYPGDLIRNAYMENEKAINKSANCNFKQVGSVRGPMRVGCFTSGTRLSSGASFYGIMELSGNVLERVVTIGNETGRSFTNNNGNGSLDENGNADVLSWPNVDAVGSGFRGGYWNSPSDYCRTSDRFEAAYTNTDRNEGYGFRCVIGLP